MRDLRAAAQNPYPQGGRYPGSYTPRPQNKRTVWPWVLLAVILVPVSGFLACTALLGGAITAVDSAGNGGTVAIGETFAYASGLAITVAPTVPH